MKNRWVSVGLAVGLTGIGLLSQGCSDDNSSSSTAISTSEIYLSSQGEVNIGAWGQNTTSGVAPDSGVVTVTVIWSSNGGSAQVKLFQNDTLVGQQAGTSPLAISADSAAGDTWSAEVVNRNSSSITANITISLLP